MDFVASRRSNESAFGFGRGFLAGDSFRDSFYFHSFLVFYGALFKFLRELLDKCAKLQIFLFQHSQIADDTVLDVRETIKVVVECADACAEAVDITLC